MKHPKAALLFLIGAIGVWFVTTQTQRIMGDLAIDAMQNARAPAARAQYEKETPAPTQPTNTVSQSKIEELVGPTTECANPERQGWQLLASGMVRTKAEDSALFTRIMLPDGYQGNVLICATGDAQLGGGLYFVNADGIELSEGKRLSEPVTDQWYGWFGSTKQSCPSYSMAAWMGYTQENGKQIPNFACVGRSGEVDPPLYFVDLSPVDVAYNVQHSPVARLYGWNYKAYYKGE